MSAERQLADAWHWGRVRHGEGAEVIVPQTTQQVTQSKKQGTQFNAAM